MGNRNIVDLLNRIADSLPRGSQMQVVNVPPPVNKDQLMELVFVVYYVGRGTFSTDQNPPQYINLQMDMFDWDGKWGGYQLGVHWSLATPVDLVTVPPAPEGSYGDPMSPVPTQDVKEWTKGQWVFRDGSLIEAVGPAQSHLIPLKNGGAQFMVTTGQTITGGTGIYEGVSGVKQATGGVHIPKEQVPTFVTPGNTFEAKTIETFRIILRDEWVSYVPPGGKPKPAKRTTSRKKS